MARKINAQFEQWRANLPLEQQPLHRLLKLLEDPSLPKQLQIDGLLACARFFSPTLTASKNSNTLDGSLELKNQPVDRIAILSAIASLPTPAEREEAARRAATLFSRESKPLLIEAEVIEDDEPAS